VPRGGTRPLPHSPTATTWAGPGARTNLRPLRTFRTKRPKRRHALTPAPLPPYNYGQPDGKKRAPLQTRTTHMSKKSTKKGGGKKC